MRSNKDGLARIWGPAVAALTPKEQITRHSRVDRAIGSDGKILPSALPIDVNSRIGIIHEDATTSTASTSVWSDAATVSISLGPGRWRVMVEASARIVNSSASSVDGRIVIDGTTGTTSAKSAPSAGAAPMFLAETVVVEGGRDISIVVQTKATSAGTASMSGINVRYDAIRVGS